jgi:hypothetical protein
LKKSPHLRYASGSIFPKNLDSRRYIAFKLAYLFFFFVFSFLFPFSAEKILLFYLADKASGGN